MFLTSAPTLLPSVTPSLRPTTMFPSAVRWVATVSAFTIVTTPIDSTEINNYATSVAEYYGVDISDVTVSTAYETTGSLTLSIPEDVSADEVVDVINVTSTLTA